MGYGGAGDTREVRVTVVAWDGVTLAADKMAVMAGQKYPVTKIHEVNGVLVGIAGNLGRGRALVEWLRAGANPETYPRATQDDEWVTMLAVGKDCVVWQYENGPHPIKVERAIHAIGSGRDYAITALLLGKTAAQSVAIASELSADCGMGCDTLTLGDA